MPERLDAVIAGEGNDRLLVVAVGVDVILADQLEVEAFAGGYAGKNLCVRYFFQPAWEGTHSV